MAHYLVLLLGGAPARLSSGALGRATASTMTWFEQLSAAGVLVARAAADEDVGASLAGNAGVHGCLLIDAAGDDDAHALAATCPLGGEVRAEVMRLTYEPSRAASGT